MYTVFRVLANEGDTLPLEKINERFALIDPEMQLAPHRRTSGCASCSVGPEGKWREQERAIEAFLETFASVIQENHDLGMAMRFDVGVYREEAKVFIATFVSAALMRKMLQWEIGIEFTFYTV